RAEVARVLGVVQEWLAGERPERLVVVTSGAVAIQSGEPVADLAGAAVWGLVRSAQTENPGRLVLADVPDPGGDAGLLARAVASGEPEVAVRDGNVYARRLARPDDVLLAPPGDGVPWRLVRGQDGTLDGLALAPCPQAAAPLGPGQVRVAVRAAGLNFRDVVLSLGLVDLQDSWLGSDVAGVVTETGPRVSGVRAGDRVFGMVSGGFGPVAITDMRLLTRIPDGWSF